MLTKGSKLYSIFTGKCPKCHEDYMYESRNPYNLGKMITMHSHCRNCGFEYQVEPSFFFGAMYVSYGVAVAVGIAIFLISFAITTNLIHCFIAIFVGLIVFMPIITRISRNIYINIFVHYDPQAKKLHSDSNHN